MGTTEFMYFWLNYSDKNSHLERIPVDVKNIKQLICVVMDLLESNKLRLFLLTDGTWINENKYLESLETTTELFVCSEGQMRKLSTYFDVKIYFYFKNIS